MRNQHRWRFSQPAESADVIVGPHITAHISARVYTGIEVRYCSHIPMLQTGRVFEALRGGTERKPCG